MNDGLADQETVNQAWDNLLKGIWGLGITQGDKTMLEQLIIKADSMIPNQDKYVQDNWQQLVDALADAKAMMDNGDALEEDIQPVADALLDAILAQRFKADKSNLEDLINKAESIDLSKYTEESVAVFQAAFKAANAVLADESLSEDDQDVVDNAVAELNAAIENLSVKDDATNPDDGKDDNSKPDDGKDEGNTSTGDNTSKPDSDKNDPAATGDATPVLLMAALATVAAAGVYLFRRRLCK